MAEVILHVYDVTNESPGYEAANFALVHLNTVCKEAVPIGGVFHTAVQVYGDEEWGYGECKQGSGVYSCPAGKNMQFSYRESIVLGRTNCSAAKVSQILKELSQEWQGNKYSMLSRNCNHFCNDLLQRLGVPKLPAWVNRFANAGDVAYEASQSLQQRLGVPKLPAWVNRFANAGDVAYEASQSLQKARDDMINAGKEAYKNAYQAAIKTPKSLIGLSKGARPRTDLFKPKFITRRIAGLDQGADQK
ncbi:PPPDE putative thiol peptidase family protein [Forsythia ovata]|uniref:PPPDE putative thiol peptidase family protein n=1 Tax=Forsythia ovata TaxID=205694 RepID=A0ABD1RMX7_9LAMI